MTWARDNPLDNAVIREVRRVREAVWKEAARTPGGIKELIRREFEAKGIQPRYAKPTKKKRSA